MDLPFILKKSLSALLQPSGLLFVFLFLAFLVGFSRYRRSQMRFFLSLAFLTFYLSTTILPAPLLRPLEDWYQKPSPREIEQAQAIVLLPCYISAEPGRDLIDRLGGETAKRFLAALRLAKSFPEKPLIIVGAGAKEGPGASYLAGLAKEFGFKNVLALDEANDTASSARVLRPYLAGRSFVLVTAAYHLPRAVFLFKRAGLKPIPYPAYRITHDQEGFSLSEFWPHPLNLFYADLAVHEYLGLAFYYILEHIPLVKN